MRDEVHDALSVRWDEAALRLPRNYGDPAAEYDAVRNAAGVVDRRDRRFLRVHGRDPVRMLQGLVSNDVANAPEGRAVYATVLTPKGKMIADVRVLKRGAELLVECDAAALEPLTAHLRKFVPPLFARFEDAGLTAIGVFGPRAHDALRQALGVTVQPAATDGSVAHDVAYEVTVAGGDPGRAPVLVITTSYAGVPGCDVICPAQDAEDVWTRLVDAGARPVGHATLDVLRIEAGTPKWGAELTDATIPLEAGLRARAISETKGCYTGQEVIIRILHRGHVNWLLRGVLLGDASAPAAGAELVSSEGKRVGRVTSAAWSPAHGQAIALAYVRREVEPGATLFLGEPAGRAAQVVELPFSA